VIVDADEQLAGVVSERDLFAMQRIGLRNVRKVIEAAADIDALCRAAGDVRRLCLNMLAQGVNAEKLTQFISGLNDSLTRRVIEIVGAGHALDGLDWAWLAFGSEGRYEQTLSTDQDNGLVFAAPVEEAAVLREAFLPFARAVNERLAQCGFPLCKGNVMASNPELCLSVDEWHGKFGGWMRANSPQALLDATIYFDFRPIYGQEDLADELRAWLLEMTRSHARRCSCASWPENAIQVEPPIGFIRDFTFDKNPEFPHTLDLKAGGARLFVDVARILSLAHGVTDSGTAQRLRALAERGKLGVTTYTPSSRASSSSSSCA
jgi:CBS domain-containing protein